MIEVDAARVIEHGAELLVGNGLDRAPPLLRRHHPGMGPDRVDPIPE
jgi:hypothetical protein